LIFHPLKPEERFGITSSLFGENGSLEKKWRGLAAFLARHILQPYSPEPQIYCAFEACRQGAEMISSGKIGCVWGARGLLFSYCSNFEG
jgi:hypothetical protein